MTAQAATVETTEPQAAQQITEQVLEQLTEAAVDDTDLPKLTPIQLASETLGRDLLQVLLQEVRAIPDVWPKLNEKKQAAVIERFRSVVERATTHAVKLIAAGGNPTISGILESVAIKEGIKATFKVSQFDPMRHELIDSQGKVCLLVVANAADHLGGMEEVKPSPDQGGLPLEGDDSFEQEMANAEAETGPGNQDPLYAEAVQFVIRERRPAISAVQRELKIGYNRAARMLEAMETDRVVGPPDENGTRLVLITTLPANDSGENAAPIDPVNNPPAKYGNYSYSDVQALLAKAEPEVTFAYLQHRLAIDQATAQGLLIRMLDDGTIVLQSEAAVPTNNTYRVAISLDDLELKMD